VRQTLSVSNVTVKTLQRLVGKCVSFSIAVPAARLFTREMNHTISKCQLGSEKHIPVAGRLRREISHWLFLESFDNPLPWRDERHVTVSIATDASNSDWGGSMLSPVIQDVSDYWTEEDNMWDISTKEAMAIVNVLFNNTSVTHGSIYLLTIRR
jgi:hypothetical protein